MTDSPREDAGAGDESPGSAPTLSPATADPAVSPGHLESIGPYNLLRKIGEGDVGEVRLAGQTEPVRRQVPLKLIKWGMDTRQVVARFEAERRARALRR